MQRARGTDTGDRWIFVSQTRLAAKSSLAYAVCYRQSTELQRFEIGAKAGCAPKPDRMTSSPDKGFSFKLLRYNSTSRCGPGDCHDGQDALRVRAWDRQPLQWGAPAAQADKPDNQAASPQNCRACDDSVWLWETQRQSRCDMVSSLLSACARAGACGPNSVTTWLQSQQLHTVEQLRVLQLMCTEHFCVRVLVSTSKSHWYHEGCTVDLSMHSMRRHADHTPG